jgi:hypothetical protein
MIFDQIKGNGSNIHQVAKNERFLRVHQAYLIPILQKDEFPPGIQALLNASTTSKLYLDKF